MRIRRTPHPFQHKLHPHLRPYFVESCQSMIDDGFHREALAWTAAFHCAATDVILADGPPAEQSGFAARRDRLLVDLGMATPEAMAAKFAQANELYDRFFALAEEIVATHPAIAD